MEDQGKIKVYEAYAKEVSRIEKSVYDVTLSNINEIVDAEKASLEIRKQQLEDLYSRGIVKAEEYFRVSKAMALESMDAQIAAEVAKVQAYFTKIGNIQTKLEELGYEPTAEVKQEWAATGTTKLQVLSDLIKKVRTDYVQLINDLNIKAINTPEMVLKKEGFVGTLNRYLDEATKNFDDWGLQIQAFADGLAKGMAQSFNTFFFDAMKGELKSLEDYWKSFTDMILQMIARIMAEWVSLKILGGVKGAGTLLSSLFAGVFHKGGVVGESPAPMRLVPVGAFANARRYHSGLAGDEELGIFQKGETIIPKGVGFGGPKQVIVNVKNETGTPVQSKDVKVDFNLEKMVVGIILKNRQQNGPLRYM